MQISRKHIINQQFYPRPLDGQLARVEVDLLYDLSDIFGKK